MNRIATRDIEAKLESAFGEAVSTAPLSSEGRFGRRVFGLDLTRTLTPEQAECLQGLLDRYKIISFPGQDQANFRLRHLERLANHFGAPIPHPKNYANYLAYKQHKAPLALPPIEQQTSSLCNLAFPGVLACQADASSPAVYIVTNLVGSGPGKAETVVGGLHWHTDIEFEQTPLSTSLFYVQAAPTTRNSAGGHWVDYLPREPGFYHPDASAELTERRNNLPLNGETAYADTAAAYADLPDDQKRELDQVMVRRRLRREDPGWLISLVYVNPRTGEKSLHSPIWASRGKNIAPVEVAGLSEAASRRYLDRLEAHILKPEYRYDHIHTPGDVTIWSNFATVHNAPPAKSTVNRPEDARLMYRISCKGEPSYRLPRQDTNAWIEANILPPYRSPADYFES